MSFASRLFILHRPLSFLAIVPFITPRMLSAGMRDFIKQKFSDAERQLSTEAASILDAFGYSPFPPGTLSGSSK